VSEQRVSASLPDSVPIESEEDHAAREADEMAALDDVGDYETDPNVMLEDVSQDIIIKTLKVSCACVPERVCCLLVLNSVTSTPCWWLRVCVCVCVRATSICVRENLHLHFLIFVCVCMQQGRHIAHKFESGWEVGVIKTFDQKGPHVLFL